MREAPTFGEKINQEKINHLKMKFFELFDGGDANKNFEVFIQDEKEDLTPEEIKELKEQLLPKRDIKEKRKERNTFEVRRERRDYIN